MFHKGANIPGKHPNVVGDGKEARSFKVESLDDLEKKKKELQSIVRGVIGGTEPINSLY